MAFSRANQSGLTSIQGLAVFSLVLYMCNCFLSYGDRERALILSSDIAYVLVESEGIVAASTATTMSRRLFPLEIVRQILGMRAGLRD